MLCGNSPFRIPIRNKQKLASRRKRGRDGESMALYSVARLPRQLGRTALPQTCEIELAYTTEISLQTAALGVEAAYQWNLNDLFDPDRTSAGQQWMYRDQFATLYQNYRAVRCEFDLILTSYQTNVGDAISCCVFPELSGSSHPSSTMQTACTFPLAQYDVAQTGAPRVHFKGTYRPWDLLGVTRRQYEVDNSYLSAIGSSPSATNVLTLIYKSVNTNQPVLVGRMLLRTTFVLYNQLTQAMS